MQKKSKKKLTLDRETLRALETGHLSQVAAGASGWVTCGPSQPSWCMICKDTGEEEN
jgi:hypothetical protein